MSWSSELALLRLRTNPGQMYARLGALKVTRAAKPVVLDGVSCTVYTVRMTGQQAFSLQPAGTRATADWQVGATVTTSFSVDAHGLPHQVLQVLSRKDGSYREVTGFSRWGARIAVTAPTGVPIVDAPNVA